MPIKDNPILCRDDKVKRAIGRFICLNTKALSYGKQVSYRLDCQHCEVVKQKPLFESKDSGVSWHEIPDPKEKPILVIAPDVLHIDMAAVEPRAVVQETKDNPFFCHNPKSKNFSEEISAEKLPDCIACPNGFCRQGKPVVDGYFPSEVE